MSAPKGYEWPGIKRAAEKRKRIAMLKQADKLALGNPNNHRHDEVMEEARRRMLRTANKLAKK